MALALTNRMSSHRRDNARDPAPNRDLTYGADDEADITLLPEFHFNNSMQAEVQTFSPVAVRSPGHLYGEISDPNEPNMDYDTSMMPESTAFSRRDFFPPYANRDPQPQPPQLYDQYRSQFPVHHHTSEQHTPPAPPHYDFGASGPTLEPIRGPSGIMYGNDEMHGSYVPHSSREPYNYHRSYSSFDAPALQFDHRDVSHNQGVVGENHPYDRFHLHVQHANNNAFQFPPEDESMDDRKQEAINAHRSPSVYSPESFPRHESTMPTYPTQNANVREQRHPSYYAEALKNSSSESPSSSSFRSPPQQLRQQNLKPPPAIAATAAAQRPALRSNSRHTNLARSQSRGRQTTPAKETPKRGAQTRSKASRRGTTSNTGTQPQSATSAASTFQTSPTSRELAEARTPRKQDALCSWFQRLNDLRAFKEANGHSRCT